MLFVILAAAIFLIFVNSVFVATEILWLQVVFHD